MTERRKFTNEEKLACIEREIKQRKYVYPKRVAAGKMSKPLMDEQIDLMDQIADDYRKLASSERLI